MSEYSKNNFTFKLCLMAVCLALYIVFSFTVKIPIVRHISLDFGYVIFAISLFIFGWKGFTIGACGCILSSLLISGWFPLGWFIGQVFIGLVCGFSYRFFDKKLNNSFLKHVLSIFVTVLSCFIGIGLIKTVIECCLFDLPWIIKLTSNSIAFAIDSSLMISGYLIAYGLKPYFLKKGVIND